LFVAGIGDWYRERYAAFDAGVAPALGKPLGTLQGRELGHALKEVDAAAQTAARDPSQVVGSGATQMPRRLDRYEARGARANG